MTEWELQSERAGKEKKKRLKKKLFRKALPYPAGQPGRGRGRFMTRGIFGVFSPLFRTLGLQKVLEFRGLLSVMSVLNRPRSFPLVFSPCPVTREFSLKIDAAFALWQQKKTLASLFVALTFHVFFPLPFTKQASLCLFGNTCIRLGMLGGKGHTPVSNWNAIMYELTWLQGWGAEGRGVIERWMPACDVRLLRHSRGNGIWMSFPFWSRWRLIVVHSISAVSETENKY